MENKVAVFIYNPATRINVFSYTLSSMQFMNTADKKTLDAT